MKGRATAVAATTLRSSAAPSRVFRIAVGSAAIEAALGTFLWVGRERGMGLSSVFGGAGDAGVDGQGLAREAAQLGGAQAGTLGLDHELDAGS